MARHTKVGMSTPAVWMGKKYRQFAPWEHDHYAFGHNSKHMTQPWRKNSNKKSHANSAGQNATL
ncbi:hypothetical protein N7510_007436 [Penicillium lagena]|uniref:uncharacterized protein n=1 Tax=Penicillium lagena TaxID=94218 RepID=UPI0025406FCE|nr:uncharacterized protein N7510_007436 [Penicillium lagena]KAJ5610717.1 hypothetical protein N7510_007436 [Penicillium lagena]